MTIQIKTIEQYFCEILFVAFYLLCSTFLKYRSCFNFSKGEGHNISSVTLDTPQNRQKLCQVVALFF